MKLHSIINLPEVVGAVLPDGDLVVDHPLDCIKALPLVWDVEGLKDMREGGVVTTDPADGSLQVEETLLLQAKKETYQDEYYAVKHDSLRQERLNDEDQLHLKILVNPSMSCLNHTYTAV